MTPAPSCPEPTRSPNWPTRLGSDRHELLGWQPGRAISLQPGETVTCTFTNTKRGTIIVEKQTSPDGATGDFTFTGDACRDHQ